MSENQGVNPEELLVALSYTQDVLVSLLIKKGIITEEELRATIKEMKEASKE